MPDLDHFALKRTSHARKDRRPIYQEGGGLSAAATAGDSPMIC